MHLQTPGPAAAHNGLRSPLVGRHMHCAPVGLGAAEWAAAAVWVGDALAPCAPSTLAALATDDVVTLVMGIGAASFGETMVAGARSRATTKRTTSAPAAIARRRRTISATKKSGPRP